MPKILLVEDNENNRDMLSRRLQRRGYEVVIAVDGPGACDRASADRPDLILMDIDLKESGSPFDGLEATRRIKGAPPTRAIPILGLTAYAMAGDRDRVLDAGCDDYDSKPINLERMLQKMQALLQRGAQP